MSDKAILSHSILNAIGQAIIDKGGATAPMLPQNMAAAIGNIGVIRKPYIETTGGAWFMTSIIPDETQTWRCCIRPFYTGGSGYKVAFGGRLASGNNTLEVYHSNNNLIPSGVISNFRFGDNKTWSTPYHTDAHFSYTMSRSGLVMVIDGKEYKIAISEYTGDISQAKAVCVGALNTNGTIGDLFSGRIYSLSCESNGHKIIDLMPKEIDGEAGMVDSVSGTFYPSDTDTPFVYGVEEMR